VHLRPAPKSRGRVDPLYTPPFFPSTNTGLQGSLGPLTPDSLLEVLRVSPRGLREIVFVTLFSLVLASDLVRWFTLDNNSSGKFLYKVVPLLQVSLSTEPTNLHPLARIYLPLSGCYILKNSLLAFKCVTHCETARFAALNTPFFPFFS